MKLNDLCFSPNIIRVIKSKRMRSAGHVARMGRREVHRGLWWGNLKERDHLEDLVVYGRIILKLIVKNKNASVWTGLMLLSIATRLL